MPAKATDLWTWEELTAALGLPVVAGPDVVGVSIDTRSLQPGDLFVALDGRAPAPFHSSGGAGRDGHDFLAKAFGAGAAAALVHKATASGRSLQVVNTFEGLWNLAGAARGRVAARVAALTGSSGKTTLRHMLSNVLAAMDGGHSSTGSLNNHWGVPLSLARMPRTTRRAVFEVGMNHPGEIAPLAELIKPEIAVVLNVLPVHLEQFADGLEGIRREKLSIAKGLQPGGVLLVPESLNHSGPGVVVYDGDRGPVILRDASGGVLGFDYRGHQLSIPAPGAGPHHVQTLRAALTVAALMDIPADTAEAAWHELPALPGRGALSMCGGVTVCDDSYNANPVSMRHALEALRARPGARHIAILGEMLELGDASPELHANLAEATAGLDGVVTVGAGFAGLKVRSPHWGHEDSVATLSAGGFAAQLRPGDQVLVKGSNRVFWVHNWVDHLLQALGTQ